MGTLSTQNHSAYAVFSISGRNAPLSQNQPSLLPRVSYIRKLPGSNGPAGIPRLRERATSWRGDPGVDLYDPPDQALDRAPHSLAHDMKLVEYMKQVVGQGPHLEAGTIGPEAMPAALVPAKGFLPLHEPVLDISPPL